jgi:hypothetical protein
MLQRKNNAEIVLNALLEGYGVKLIKEYEELFMAEDYSIGIKCVPLDENSNPVPEKEGIFPIDLTLKDFIKLCQELSDFEIIGLTSNIALNALKGKIDGRSDS